MRARPTPTSRQVVATPVVLSTLNARYIHTAFGLRYLRANLGESQDQCVIEEFTLESRPEDIVEQILRHQPKVVGFGVYIWNVIQTEQVVALLKAVSPEVKVVLGGPEVSYELETQSIVQRCDFVITGWGDVSFARLVRSLLNHERVEQKIIAGEQPKLDQIRMPYHLYTEDDIKNRILYVEASRGCPFKCEFCLSALDKTAWPFDLALFLEEMGKLYDRGARHFKFVDRTFNLNIKNSLRILDFFIERLDSELFLHFEVIPDHLPNALKQIISKFPAGSLQFEIGIQTFDPEVQALISRRQNNSKAQQNLRWIREQTQAHVHADLIFGLPGETMESFAESFDQLYQLRPHEIQVGILKRLKGSPIIRHTEEYGLVFNPNPPFSIASSDAVNYMQVQAMNRFARYWDIVGNSGHFRTSLEILLADQPFHHFSQIAQALFERTGQTHKISLLRLYDLVFVIAVEELQISSTEMLAAIEQDFQASGLKSIPHCLGSQQSKPGREPNQPEGRKRHNSRQSRH